MASECKREGTHYACDCVPEQLALADKLAEAVRYVDALNSVTFTRIKNALAAYEKARKG